MVGFFQSHTVALDGTNHFLDGFVLCDDVRLQLLSHALQSDTFLLGHALNWDSAHHRYHFSDILCRHSLADIHLAAEPFLIQLL